MKRTFIAIDILPSSNLKEVYELIRYRMRLERITWVPVGNTHITLNFLGDTEEQGLDLIVRILGEIAFKHALFELVLRSFGVFKSLRDPRVLWLGCDPCPALSEIKKDLDLRLETLGFQPENRNFSPHLTLGRIKEIRQLNQLAQIITLYKDVVFQTQTVDKITLYESKLTSAGAEYVVIEEFILKSPFS